MRKDNNSPLIRLAYQALVYAVLKNKRYVAAIKYIIYVAYEFYQKSMV